MADVTFKIYRSDIENSPKIFDFSPYELYHTTRIDENGKQTFDGDISGYMILNGSSSIPASEYDTWVSSVYEYIYEHSRNIENETNMNVVFVIRGVDTRFAYDYDEIVNGKVVKSGMGWGKDFELEIERNAWIKAVTEYNKEHGIEMPSDVIRDKLDKIEKSIQSLDNELPGQLDVEMPDIAKVIPDFDNNPCEFVSEIKRVSEMAVPMINGLPSVKDVINYNIKVQKENLVSALTSATDAEIPLLEAHYKYMYGDELTDDYWTDLDAYEKEMSKYDEDDIAYFEVVAEPEHRAIPVAELLYANAEPANGAYPTLNNTPSYGGESLDYDSYSGTMDTSLKQKKKEAVRKFMQNRLAGQKLSLSNLEFNPDVFVDLCYAYNFDLPLLLAQAWCESFFGTTSMARKHHNIFSVGMFDDGSVRVRYSSQSESIPGFIKLVQKDYLQNGKVSVGRLLSNYVNYAGNRYASDPNYESKLKQVRNKAISMYPVLANGYTTPMEIDFSQIEYHEITFDNIYNKMARYNPDPIMKQHVAESMRYFWVPVKKAWEQYAKNTLKINPTWIITSGYRPVGCPSQSGGGKQPNNGSSHITGYAIDVQPVFDNTQDKIAKVKALASFMRSFLKNNQQISFDQYFVEYKGASIKSPSTAWIHMQYRSKDGKLKRRRYSYAVNVSGHSDVGWESL